MNRQVVDSRFRLDPELRFDRPELRHLLALWEEKRGDRALPDRTDFSPFILKPYLPRVLIYQVVGEPPARRFRFRLYGTLVTQYSGRNPTGRYVDESMSSEAYADFDRALSWVCDEARPLRATGTYYFVDRSFVHFESISMPITVAGEMVEQVINITYYADEARP